MPSTALGTGSSVVAKTDVLAALMELTSGWEGYKLSNLNTIWGQTKACTIWRQLQEAESRENC